jgi:hypothetical protein
MYYEYDMELAQKKKEKTPAHPMPEQFRICLEHVKQSVCSVTHGYEPPFHISKKKTMRLDKPHSFIFTQKPYRNQHNRYTSQ